ncbi:sigma-54 interaction domain-containing protein [Sporomusa sp.]|uniref:sigma-54 interaction domain-containing protein n=1 Tax=Sporomusa sp. TaxID=2078658 RepID=UPI002C823699|nr:sigma 54-interacting transcriptional regulator [Sporomusa sp.]HWR42743.1 sigma 54-interacting transcriptional regulator [Sporomusa sp.]
MENAAETRTLLAELRHKIQVYETILERLDVGIHVIDNKGKTIVYNDTMSKLECCDAAEVLGKDLLSAMPHLTTEISTLLTVLGTGKALPDRQQNYINARGKQIVTVNSTTPLITADKVMGALEIAKDITFIQALADKIVNLQENLIKQKKGGQVPHHPNTRYTIENILGEAPLLKVAIHYAERAARTPSNVLIFGETGTGKELFAQSIHNLSPRKHHPFVAINCAALPEQLLEGLLFGTTKGGFTGAIDRAGLFEQANGGTLLLDELNSMNMELQAKLLRVLQENIVRRVGAVNEVPVNVRVIATMNMEPAAAIEQKRLREDLYYRLGVVTIRIPALRERKSDIAIYTAAFIKKYNSALNVKVKGISPEVEDIFRRYNWPGNVRELQHVIEGAMNLITTEEYIGAAHLPMLFCANAAVTAEWPHEHSMSTISLASSQTLVNQTESMEKNSIAAALAATGGNITQAAARLGLARQVLQYKIKKYKLK